MHDVVRIVDELPRGTLLTKDVFPDGFEAAALQELTATEDPSRKARLNYLLGGYAFGQGDMASAIRYFQESLRLAEEASDTQQINDANRALLGVEYELIRELIFAPLQETIDKHIPGFASRIEEIKKGYKEANDTCCQLVATSEIAHMELALSLFELIENWGDPTAKLEKRVSEIRNELMSTVTTLPPSLFAMRRGLLMTRALSQCMDFLIALRDAVSK